MLFASAGAERGVIFVKRPSVTILVANLPAEKDRRVIRECLSLEAAGFDVTVIAPRGDKNLTVLPGSDRTRLRPYPVDWPLQETSSSPP